MFSRQPPLPPASRFSFLRPKVFCVTTIRRLFLEIYDSFSEIRRDLCSSYFYCRSNSLEKNRNLYESFIFILARVKGNVLGRAVGRDLPSALTLSEAWRFPSRWPAVFSPSGLHVLLSAPLCPQRVCSSYLLGCGYPEAQTGQARRETAWRGLFEVLMGGSTWDLTLSSSRLASSSEDRLCHLPAGWPRSQQVTLIKSHHTTRQPCNGYKTSWDLLCQSWES